MDLKKLILIFGGSVFAFFAFCKDGALYISDDKAGSILIETYRNFANFDFPKLR